MCGDSLIVKASIFHIDNIGLNPIHRSKKRGNMNTKAKGNRNELKSIKYYEKQGYYCTKSGGSLGMWDFVGYSKSDWLCVQVKSNRSPNNLEMMELQEAIVPPHTKKLIHVWKDYARSPEITEL